VQGLIIAPEFAADANQMRALPPKVRRNVRHYAGEAPGKFLVFMDPGAPPLLGDNVVEVGKFLAWAARYHASAGYDVWKVYASDVDGNAMIEHAAVFWGRA
jgi:hypothetical protein